MIQSKYLILLILVAMTVAWACKPAPNAVNTTQGISEALAENNIEAARSRADALFNTDFNIEATPVNELCALSLVLARLSQTDDSGNDYAAQALKCYNSAVGRDSVAASRYFESVAPEDYTYLQLLRQLRRQVAAREAGISITEEEHE